MNESPSLGGNLNRPKGHIFFDVLNFSMHLILFQNCVRDEPHASSRLPGGYSHPPGNTRFKAEFSSLIDFPGFCWLRSNSYKYHKSQSS